MKSRTKFVSKGAGEVREDMEAQEQEKMGEIRRLKGGGSNY